MHELALALIIAATPVEYVAEGDGFAVWLPDTPGLASEGDARLHILSGDTFEHVIMITVDRTDAGHPRSSLRSLRETVRGEVLTEKAISVGNAKGYEFNLLRDRRYVVVRILETPTRTITISCRSTPDCRKTIASFHFTN